MVEQNRVVFTVEERDRARDRVLELARADPRVVAGALMGSLAHGGGDRWSDLDLSFGVDDGTSATEVLNDLTAALERELDAVTLFDLPRFSTIYRVFLLPGCLQLDLSVTPASEFGARGPRFRLLFGSAAEHPTTPPPAADYLLGFAAHHAVRARICVARGRVWEAEYWVSAVRDYALALACRRRGLPTDYGRGYDELPLDVLARAAESVPRSLEAAELLRARDRATELLLAEADEARALAERLEPRLRDLASDRPA